LCGEKCQTLPSDRSPINQNYIIKWNMLNINAIVNIGIFSPSKPCGTCFSLFCPSQTPLLLTKRAFVANLTWPNQPTKACFPLTNPAEHVSSYSIPNNPPFNQKSIYCWTNQPTKGYFPLTPISSSKSLQRMEGSLDGPSWG